MSLDESTRLKQWVVSLGVSVTCCAALFVIFAAFLLDNQRQYVEAKVRIDYLEERLAAAENHVMWQSRQTANILRGLNQATTTPM
ncbi:MAG: hypothetical protein EBZ69_10185, partial [Alphaproteobacteria bacterium]|nr:hypothetical protein [Alphaproteobacteria bacterium]